MTPTCTYCPADAEYMTCCGSPADGSAGTGCIHEGDEHHDPGEPVCAACWQRLAQTGEISSASARGDA